MRYAYIGLLVVFVLAACTQPIATKPANPEEPGNTCPAFMTGFVYSPAENDCIEETRSGCNIELFEHNNYSSCAAANEIPIQ